MIATALTGYICMKITLIIYTILSLSFVKCAEILSDVNPFIAGYIQEEDSLDPRQLSLISEEDEEEHKDQNDEFELRKCMGHDSIEDIIEADNYNSTYNVIRIVRQYNRDTLDSREDLNGIKLESDSSEETESNESESNAAESSGSKSTDGDHDIRVKVKGDLIIYYTRNRPIKPGNEQYAEKQF